MSTSSAPAKLTPSVSTSTSRPIALEIAVRSEARLGRLVLIDSLGRQIRRARGARHRRHLCACRPRRFGAASFSIRPAPCPIMRRSATMSCRRSPATARRPRSTAGSPTCTTRPAPLAAPGDPPALVLWGENDGIVTPDYGERLAAALPNARFEPIAQAGALPADRTARAVAARSNTFTGTETEAMKVWHFSEMAYHPAWEHLAIPTG